MEPDIPVKIIILGEENAGKSCILARYLTGRYDETQKNTVGAQFMTKKVVFQNKVLKLNIWDTAGQERYQSFSKMYCRDAKAAILVYDLSNPSSFHAMKKWYEIMNEDALPLDCLLFVAGSKCDLGTHSSETRDLIEEFCFTTKSEHFLVSAKSGEGIEELFSSIIQQYCKGLFRTKNSIVIGRNNNEKPKKKRFC